jgi:predicted  nucleic acid-binding Zn-ribbon protein
MAVRNGAKAAVVASPTAAYLGKALKLESLPWDDLAAPRHLQAVLQAMLQRIEAQDQMLAKAAAGGAAAGKGPASPCVAVLPAEELEAMRQRLSDLENVALQGQVKAVVVEGKPSPLQVASNNAREKGFKLAQHVIPLTQLKSRLEAAEAGVAANAEGVDAAKAHVSNTATALHEELEAALEKMATKEELQALEAKHDKLQEQVDKISQDLEERFKKLEDAQAALEKRTSSLEERMDRTVKRLEEVAENVRLVAARTAALEELMPTKADRVPTEAAIEELRAELAKIDVDAIMAALEECNKRVDLMDARCDKMDDAHQELKSSVLRWQKEMEDLQLERQIENLRRELEEAKTGVFLKATQRMDSMQEETNELREALGSAQGQIHVNRESIEEIEGALRDGVGPSTGAGSGASRAGSANMRVSTGTRALIDQLQDNLAKVCVEERGWDVD